MPPPTHSPRLSSLLCVLYLISARCTLSASPNDTTNTPPPDAPTDVVTTAIPCSPADDPDSDGISNRFEGPGDTDSDGTPNTNDPDSDNDGIADSLEASPFGHPRECTAPPPDSDLDGHYDFIDTDSNNDGISDTLQASPSPNQPGSEQIPPTDCLQNSHPGINPNTVTPWTCHPFDTDRDGDPDYRDTDSDGDRINNTTEISPGTPENPTDTDSDLTPDYRDTDSDSDTITDHDEGSNDRDNDTLGNYRDTDSDSDTITDQIEAGDSDPGTAPVECPREINVRTLDQDTPHPDGIADFLDNDSDNDGLSDLEETTENTNRCNPDTDSDTQLDIVETAWCHNHQRTLCATNPSVRIPDTDYYLVLPFDGPALERELEFSSNLRIADVFFLTDTTGSMDGVLNNVRASITAPSTGLIDSITRIIPDTYFGVSHYDDFAIRGYGTGADRPLWPMCPGPPSTPGCVPNSGITVQPPSMAAAVQATVNSITLGSGLDGPEAQVEALYQTITGEGLYDHSHLEACRDGAGRAPCWIAPTQCLDGTRGMPCFRTHALPIVIHFTDAEFHNGAPEQTTPGTPPANPYVGISPTPHTFSDLITAYTRASGRVINLNAAQATRCAGTFPTTRTPGRPCYDFRLLAEGTSSVDLDGTPLVFDLPDGAVTVSQDFVSSIVNAVNTIATRVPFDIDTVTRNDPTNPPNTNATLFIHRRSPSCQNTSPPNTNCWTPPTQVPHRSAVARTDLSTFYRVIPGTRVRFTLTFQNNVFVGHPLRSSLFHAFIDVVGDGVTVLDTREVYILVPAAQPSPGGSHSERFTMPVEHPGLSPRSALFTAAVTAIATLATLRHCARSLQSIFTHCLTSSVTAAHSTQAISLALRTPRDLALCLSPVCITAFTTAILVTLAQRALPDEPGPPAPHPASTFTTTTLFLTAGPLSAWTAFRSIAHPSVSLAAFSTSLYTFAWSLALIALTAGLADLLWRFSRWKHTTHQHSLTHRDNSHHTGPSPQVKSRLRARPTPNQ